MLYQRSQFSNSGFRKLLQKRFKQPFSSVIRRGNKRIERLRDVRGSDVRAYSNDVNDVFGRYYPSVTGNNRASAADDSLSDLVLQNLKRNSQSFLRQYVDNIYKNQSVGVSRRGGLSQSQNFVQIADLINRGVNRNK